MIYKIGNFSRSADVRVARVDDDFPKLLERVVDPLRHRLTQCKVLIESHGVKLENLSARLESLEKAKGSLEVISTMRGEIGSLRTDI